MDLHGNSCKRKTGFLDYAAGGSQKQAGEQKYLRMSDNVSTFAKKNYCHET